MGGFRARAAGLGLGGGGGGMSLVMPTKLAKDDAPSPELEVVEGEGV
jgi:hypothetical protein